MRAWIVLVVLLVAVSLIPTYWPIMDWKRRQDADYPPGALFGYRQWKVLFLLGIFTGTISLMALGYFLDVMYRARRRAKKAAT